MKKIISSLWLSATTMAVSAIPVLAAPAGEKDITLKPGFWPTVEALTIPSLISGLIKLALIIAAIVFFFMLVIGGIQWIVSGGDKAATEAARGRITAALIGLVIVFAAWAIAQLINTFFAIDIFKLAIPTV